MKSVLLLSAAAFTFGVLAVSLPAQAAFGDVETVPSAALVTISDGGLQFASSGHGSGGDDDSGHDSDDDGHHSGGHHSGDDDDSNDDSNDDSGSGRSKKRVPGGSGCDSANDIQEHAGCSA